MELIHAGTEVVSQVSHLPGVEVHYVGQPVAPDLFGQLGHIQRLEEDAIFLPGGSRASMVSISWVGLLF